MSVTGVGNASINHLGLHRGVMWFGMPEESRLAISTPTGKQEAATVNQDRSDENTKESVKDDFSQVITDKKAAFLAKVRNGSTEESFQIGAGSYTESEWKKMLLVFDAIQGNLRDSDEAAERLQDTEDWELDGKGGELLLAELTTAVYPSGDPEKEDDRYDTFYSPDGIYCKKKGQAGFEWEIRFEDPSQYEKVMAFLQGLGSRDNLRFACHENFWRDFLADEIDLDAFRDFLETRVSGGVPNYLDEYENGVRIDRQAAGYAKYMNPPGFVSNVCYTAEEAFRTFGPDLSGKRTFDFEAMVKKSYPRFIADYFIR